MGTSFLQNISSGCFWSIISGIQYSMSTGTSNIYLIFMYDAVYWLSEAFLLAAKNFLLKWTPIHCHPLFSSFFFAVLLLQRNCVKIKAFYLELGENSRNTFLQNTSGGCSVGAEYKAKRISNIEWCKCSIKAVAERCSSK